MTEQVWCTVKQVQALNGVITKRLSCGHKQEIVPLLDFPHAVSLARATEGSRVRCGACEKEQEEKGQGQV